jgi:hypothetical protein
LSTKEAAMKNQNIDAAGPLHIRVLVLDSGEEAFSILQSFAREARRPWHRIDRR